MPTQKQIYNPYSGSFIGEQKPSLFDKIMLAIQVAGQRDYLKAQTEEKKLANQRERRAQDLREEMRNIKVFVDDEGKISALKRYNSETEKWEMIEKGESAYYDDIWRYMEAKYYNPKEEYYIPSEEKKKYSSGYSFEDGWRSSLNEIYGNNKTLQLDGGEIDIDPKPKFTARPSAKETPSHLSPTISPDDMSLNPFQGQDDREWNLWKKKPESSNAFF